MRCCGLAAVSEISMSFSLSQTRSLRARLLAASILGAASGSAFAGSPTLPVSTGQYITPHTTPGAHFNPLITGLADNPTYRAGNAMNTALSPDGKTLLVVTSGYNLLNYTSGPNAGQGEPADSTEYVFVYDTSTPRNVRNPVPAQVLQIPNSFAGLVWSPDGTKFYVAGGISDDVMVFSQANGSWAQSSSIALGHTSFGAAFSGTPYAALGAFLYNGIGFEEPSSAAGLAITPDGATLLVANIYNDSVSAISTASGSVLWEYDLRPYKNTPAAAGTAGGESPFAIAIKGTPASGYSAYVTSVRDREVVVLPVAATPPAAGTLVRIALPGSPNQLVLSHDQTRLYVAQDNSDNVAVIDTASNSVIEEIDAIAPPGLLNTAERYTGAATNSVALSPDNSVLYATNGGANDVAVIPLSGPAPHSVAGLIPTGWYPHSVTVSADGKNLYVVNGKSDPGHDRMYETGAANQYVEQLEHAGFLAVPVPTASDLAAATLQVAANNSYTLAPNATATATMAALHAVIKHVIYIIKENRTFDQILGDLHNGSNGAPALTMYGKAITPNFHALASNFVTLDNFLCSGEVSGDGWAWSTEARESDFGVKTIPMNYANRGSSNDSEGSNRIIDVGISLSARLSDYPSLGNTSLYAILSSVFPGGTVNLLPGTNDDFATDGPEGTPEQQGYLWDAALRAGLSVRDYGFFNDIVRYNIPVSIGGVPLIENPAATSTTVAWPTNPTLAPTIDPYFRGFDNAFPDTWRWEEWNREFQLYVAGNNLPTLSLVRFMHDHTGNFDTAAAGINTPDLQQADNDYAVGKLVETVANSPYASSTLIFVLEDDSQDGPDHVDAHRSTAYVVGPYVKQKAIVSTQYSTINMLRTIEDILGIDHLNLNDATQPPMADMFDLTQTSWSYTAVASPLLTGTGLQPLLPASAKSAAAMKPAHDAAWWSAHTKGYDWSSEDRIPADEYNRVQWEGLKGSTPYPN
jgi:YVTN family beta-propeller protein